MNDMYTEGEICGMYREAQHKRRQVSILADLCSCNRERIVTILTRRGYDVPTTKQLNRPHRKWKPEFTAALPGLLAAGYGVPKLAAHFGVAKTTVITHMRNLNLYTVNSRKNKEVIASGQKKFS